MTGQNTPQDAPHAHLRHFPCCEAPGGWSARDDAAQARDEFRDRGVIIADLIRERDDALAEVKRLTHRVAKAEGSRDLALESAKQRPADAEGCSCSRTDPSTWLSAASCGYGSGYEPGSMWEFDPDCPEHGNRAWCAECEAHVPIDEEWDDQVGFEEQARYVHVQRLDCGHEIVTPARTWHGEF